MTCICAQKLADLLKALLSLEIPPIGLPIPLQQLASMSLGGSATPESGLSTNLTMKLPELGLSPMAMAQLSAAAQAKAAVSAGFGIDITAPNASAMLSATIGTANANLSAAFGMFAGFDLAPWMALSALASLAMNCQLAFGLDLFGGGLPALTAALNAAIGAPPLGLPAGLQSYAALASAAASFGIDISASGAMGSLMASLNAVASLELPSIDLSLGLLVMPLALLAAIANIIAGLGLNPFDRGFSAATLNLTAGLPQFANLHIPADLALGDPGSYGAGALAGLNLEAMADLDVSALASFQAPNLGPLTALASFSASASAAGFPLASASACGSSCPMSLSIG
jgi:hypothetical protein